MALLVGANANINSVGTGLLALIKAKQIVVADSRWILETILPTRHKNNKKNSNKENKLPMLRKPLEQECSDRVKKMEPVRLKQAQE